MYAIFDKENPDKVYFLDENRETLAFTISADERFIDADIVEVSDVEQGFDGAWYRKGCTPEMPVDVAMAKAKEARADAVSRITVTVDGLVFDGDETAQDRMARAITMFNAGNLPAETVTPWVLADNTVAEVTVAQLSRALLLAGQAQTALWTIPYEG